MTNSILLKQALTEMAENLRETVEKIEADPSLTEEFFDAYFKTLSEIDDSLKSLGMACALVRKVKP